jgi:hypothetical protein
VSRRGGGCNLWRGSLNRDSGRPSPIPPVKCYEGGKEGQRRPENIIQDRLGQLASLAGECCGNTIEGGFKAVTQPIRVLGQRSHLSHRISDARDEHMDGSPLW